MGDDPSVKRLIELLQKSPEKLAAVKCLVEGEPLADPQPHPPPASASSSPQVAYPAGALVAVIEGDPASGHFCIRVAPAAELSQAAPPEPAEPGPAALSVAAKVFQLLAALDSGRRLRRAPPVKVFLLRFRQNLSYSEIARACHCTRSLVSRRLKAIGEQLPWKPQQLRELSAHVESMQDALSDSRARRIYRKGAVYGEEEDSEGLD